MADKTVIFKIFRYNPEKDTKSYIQDFTVKVFKGMTILEALHEIKNNQDSTLSMRFSCRMGVCGSCAMLINGSPTLACNTQVLDISDSVITLAPLPNFDVIKDLVPDLSTMIEKHISIKPHILRKDQDEIDKPTGEFYQSTEDLVKYLQFAYCIKCGCCMAACPTVATDRDYIGPMAITQAYRYSADNRDGGYEERKETVGDSHGVYRCHYAGECSNVCPKGVDPAKALQLMKRMLVKDYINLLDTKEPCKAMSKPEGVKRRDDIPYPPEYTVK